MYVNLSELLVTYLWRRFSDTHLEMKIAVREETRASLDWNKIKEIQFLSWRTMEVSTDGPDRTGNKERSHSD